MSKQLKNALSITPIALKEYGIEEAFYIEDGERKFARTEKGVKLFLIHDGKRVNFWMPKNLLEMKDGSYTHIKHYAIKFLRKNIAEIAIKNELQIELF